MQSISLTIQVKPRGIDPRRTTRCKHPDVFGWNRLATKLEKINVQHGAELVVVDLNVTFRKKTRFISKPHDELATW